MYLTAYFQLTAFLAGTYLWGSIKRNSPHERLPSLSHLTECIVGSRLFSVNNCRPKTYHWGNQSNVPWSI